MAGSLARLQSSFPDTAWTSEKRFFEGTHRSCPPAETLARLNGIAEQIGVTRVAVLTGLDRIGIPVVMVCRPQNRSLSVYQGKGLTLEAAKVSGLMESLERYCGEYLRAPDFVASHAGLPAGCVTPEFDLWPAPSGSHRDPDAPMGWIAGLDLLRSEKVYVPYPVVHFDKRVPGPDGADQFANTSTGLAGGNSYAEALVHALCEIIERDALTLWRLLPTPHQAATRIAVDSVADPNCRALIAAIHGAGLQCAMWDISREIRVPAFLCRIVEMREDGYRPSDLVDGTGCHPAREIALSRAITEAAQVRAVGISGARNDLFRSRYRPPAAEQIAGARKSIGRRDQGRSFEECTSAPTGSSAEDLGFLLDELRRHVRHVIAVDLTHPATGGVPAVRVLVPELEDGEEMERYVPRRRAVRAYLGRS